MQDIKSHTSLRGIAALLVVVFHFRNLLTPVVEIDQHTSFFLKGYLWVDFFFILSGFILSHVYDTRPGQNKAFAMRFLYARFARIYPLHIASLLFLLLLQIVASSYFKKDIHLGGMFSFGLNVLNIHGWGLMSYYDWNYPSWSISAEMAAYFLFPLICLGLNKKRNITITILILLIIAYFLDTLNIKHNQNWERKVLLNCLPMFFIGIILYQFRPLSLNAKPSFLTFLQLTSLSAIIFILHTGAYDHLIAIPFALLIFSTQTDRGWISAILNCRPLVSLGLWSYSIYLLHICLSKVLSLMWPKFIAIPLNFTQAQSAMGLFISSILITLACGFASYILFEMPARKAILNKLLVKS